MMFYLRQILCGLALTTSVSAFAEGGILYIGDSLSNGYLTKEISKRLATAFPGSPVRVISVPGSKSRNWRQDPPYSTDWSIHDVGHDGRQTATPKGATPDLAELLATEKPRILIVQQGTNEFWGWADSVVEDVRAGGRPWLTKDHEEVRGLLDTKNFLKARGFSLGGAKRCLWVAPPDMIKWDLVDGRGKRTSHIEDAIYHGVNGAVAKICTVLDGRKSTRYPGGPSDGVHYPDTPAARVQREKWVDAIVQEAARVAR